MDGLPAPTGTETTVNAENNDATPGRSDPQPEASAQPSTPSRERSTVRFPYADLDTAVEVAKLVAQHGLDCTQGQLAAGLNVDAGSAPYRARVSAAQTFGLVESIKNTGVALTPLGRRINDPEQESAARADAFLHVELYRKIFELFDGTVLPADKGLEAEMVKAGVAAKQVTKARQAFARSADQAGFFNAGRTRLVRPSGVTLAATGREEAPPPPPPNDQEEGILSNALLSALFQRMLPEEGQEFTARERKRFFRALAVNLDVIYGEPQDGELDTGALGQLYVVQAKQHEQQRTPVAAIPQPG